MSRQFQMYVLPSDLEQIISTLRSQLNVELVSPASPSSRLHSLKSPIKAGSLLPAIESVCADCCLISGKDADVRLNYYSTPAIWRIADTSEVISISGCDFDGKTLVRGRFYFQNDFLIGADMIRKKKPFLAWADKVFALAKKQMTRSSTLDAYVGGDAKKWQEAGGRYASLALPGHEPLYDPRQF